ncbi:hypothetical protein FOZ62_017290, partial [Perkinsus olseni]
PLTKWDSDQRTVRSWSDLHFTVVLSARDMWTVVQLLCLCTLGVSLPPSNAPSSHLKFYKDIGNPWYIKDAPYCAKTSTLCPTDPSYTWDYYFDYLLGKGVSSFLLGGYSVEQSKIKTDSPPWDKARFAALKQQ